LGRVGKFAFEPNSARVKYGAILAHLVAHQMRHRQSRHARGITAISGKFR
jgi:uncharacterized damage-inducible protein DinB